MNIFLFCMLILYQQNLFTLCLKREKNVSDSSKISPELLQYLYHIFIISWTLFRSETGGFLWNVRIWTEDFPIFLTVGAFRWWIISLFKIMKEKPFHARCTVMNRSANFFLFTREPESITQGKNLFLSRLAMLFIIIRETSMKWKIPVTQKSVLDVSI